ncbi:MAG TPA: ATP-dependent protease subunit HslV [Kofleriaceae bacterium]|nr:ATP-dependent protease subunit HslV [Kofleriaceae bacterium]
MTDGSARDERRIRSTTILTVRRNGAVVLAGDGQVSFGNTIMKAGARKVRRLGEGNGNAIAGFAGSAADGLALFERLDSKLREHRGNLRRASVELAKDWRSDKALRRLEAMLLVADREATFLLSGSGDIIEPDDGIAAIGSGGPYALSAARALFAHTEMPARAIAEAAMGIAGDICIYTNRSLTIEELS